MRGIKTARVHDVQRRSLVGGGGVEVRGGGGVGGVPWVAAAAAFCAPPQFRANGDWRGTLARSEGGRSESFSAALPAATRRW